MNCDHEIEMHGNEWVHKNNYPADKNMMPSHPKHGLLWSILLGSLSRAKR
jgi:hypothetical protein